MMYELCTNQWLGPIILLMVVIICGLVISIKNKRIVELTNDRQEAFRELAKLKVQQILPKKQL